MGFEPTTVVVIGIDCTGSFKIVLSYDHDYTMTPRWDWKSISSKTYNNSILIISIYQGDSREVWRLIVFAPFLIIIIPLSFFLSSAKSLSDTFLGDYRTKINETSQEC